ncbi:MAG TPA: lysine-sensitive aspartokinase 3 [Thermoanaerobaculia bacterium]|jgi:aspartate kinase|nr:lysine-sensitive aspartokinase 3 [Thermoanaerobaculia bacterium]
MIVIKFGGTSVGDADRVANAIDIVAERQHLHPVIVVSALAGVTNDLVAASEAACAQKPREVAEIIRRVRARHEDVALRLVQQKSDFFETFIRNLDKQIEEIDTILRGIALLGEITPRARDKVVSIGEKLSSVLFTYTMMMRALPGEHVHSEEVIWTDDRFGGATPNMALTAQHAKRVLLPLLERNRIPVMGGFIGRTESGATTTLGRNGSDYSAAIVGAAVGAKEVQIWTDVDGLLTCDPRVVPGARVIDVLSFEEAAELAQFGAKLHPRTLEPAVEANVPVRVLNTHNPSSPGTLITRTGAAVAAGPRSIARKRGVTMVHVTSNKMLGTHGFLAKFFRVFADLEISVDLIATSEVSVTVTVDEKHDIDELTKRLSELANVELYDGQCIIAVVGKNVMSDARVGARVLEALGNMPVKMMSLGRSGLNLSIVVDDANADAAVKAVHHALFETAVPA